MLLRASTRKEIVLDVDFTDDDGMTALMWASFKGHYTIVYMLMNDGGVNVMQKTPENMTALTFASMRGHAHIVKRLNYHKSLWYGRYVLVPIVSVVAIIIALHLSIPMWKGGWSGGGNGIGGDNVHSGVGLIVWVSAPMSLLLLVFVVVLIGDRDLDGDRDMQDLFFVIDEDQDKQMEMNELFSAGFAVSGVIAMWVLVNLAFVLAYAHFVNKRAEEKVNKTKNEATRQVTDAKRQVTDAKRQVTKVQKQRAKITRNIHNHAKRQVKEGLEEAHKAVKGAKQEVVETKKDAVNRIKEIKKIKIGRPKAEVALENNVWQCYIDKQWVDYPTDICLLLEEMFQTTPTDAYQGMGNQQIDAVLMKPAVLMKHVCMTQVCKLCDPKGATETKTNGETKTNFWSAKHLKIGDFLDAKDTVGKWCAARIIEKDSNLHPGKIKVHFTEWKGSKYDAWYSVSSQELRRNRKLEDDHVVVKTIKFKRTFPNNPSEIEYRVDICAGGTMQQVNENTKFSRDVRRVIIDDKKWSEGVSKKISSTCTKYNCQLARDGVTTLENQHFNFAAMQFAKFLPGKTVTRVEYWDNQKLQKKFKEKKKEFKAKGYMDERWVFHGTGDNKNVPLIMENGFKVGGQNGWPIANAAIYGQGIYCAIGLRMKTPLNYAGKTNQLILCESLAGHQIGTCGCGNSLNCVHASGPCNTTQCNQDQTNGGDSWIPHADWRVFKTSDQLLPKYVVHYTIPIDKLYAL